MPNLTAMTPEKQQLRALGVSIRSGHKDIVLAGKSFCSKAADIGTMLTEAKRIVGHGLWKDWIEANCPFAERTARFYMSAASNLDSAKSVFAVLEPPAAKKPAARPNGPATSSVETSKADDAPPKTPPKPEPEPDPLRDEVGRLVPKALVDLFNERMRFKQITTEITRQWKLVDAMSTSPIGSYLNAQAIDVDLTNARRSIKAATPFAVCPKCKGKGCKACKNLGWMNKQVYDAVPEEFRTAIGDDE